MRALDRRDRRPNPPDRHRGTPSGETTKMASPARGPVAMLHGIEVNVIEVPRKIVLVAQHMFPTPPLPNPALAFGGAAGGDAPPGEACEKPLLIRRQRVAKSASPSGRAQTAWRCSGKITAASMVKG